MVALVVVLNPGPWWVVAIIIVCLIGQDVLVPFNYFLALILVTPMSLLAIEAGGQGGAPAGLLSDRLLGTLIGMAIALIITWATSSATNSPTTTASSTAPPPRTRAWRP